MATVTKIRFLIDNVQDGLSHSNVAIAEVELRTSVGGVDETTNTGGTATASGDIGSGYEADKAVDDNNDTMWNSAFTAGSSWWAFELTTALDLIEYTFTSRPTFYGDTPTEWIVQEWKDSAWVNLKNQSTPANWTGNEKRTFILDRTKLLDINTEIAADPTTEFLDLLSDIQATGDYFKDLKTNIEATFTTEFADLKTEICSKAQKLLDLLGDVRAGNLIISDLKIEISAKAQVITDLKTFLKAISYNFRNLNTSIEAVRSKWWLNTEIKAGCAARWNFNTEWNPNRLLYTQIAAKKPYEFSFKMQSAEGFAAIEPSVEFKIPGYSFPLRTLFLDYIAVGGINEYQLELWWARGLIGKGALKNAKIKAEYINTQYSGGYEVVTCDWISCKVNSGEYQTVNETPLLLGDIQCDSYLDFTLKVECRDCSLTRGLIFFKLNISGDYKESIYGDKIVYQDGSRYHAGEYDDYQSIDFICRLYVV